MIVYGALAPLGLTVAALSVWSLYNGLARGRVRSRGWVTRDEQPGFFWFVFVFTLCAGLWFGFIGVFVSADLMGLIR
jgi:hypothetical protein